MDRDKKTEAAATFDVAEWGQRAAQEIMDEHAGAAALDTADYMVCSFVEAAARLALADKTIAERIGALMEPPRKGLDR